MKSTRNMLKRLLAAGVLLLAFTLAGQREAAAETWTELTPVGGPPAARHGASAVYAPDTNRMVVFGGNGNPFGFPPFFNDVWVLSNANGIGAPEWTPLAPSGGPPSSRVEHTAVYDPATNRMIMFAGNPNVGFCFATANDVWVLSNADGSDADTPSWGQLATSGGPPSPRWLHSAVYDANNNRMIVFGGGNACGPNDNQVWVLQNANGLGGTPTWTQLFPSGGPPLAREHHTAVYDEVSNRMIVFGGNVQGVGVTNDVWVLQNANGLGGTPNWVQLAPTGGPPDARNLHTAVYDPNSNSMSVFGGGSAAGRLNDVWVLQNANGLGGTPNWIQLAPTGTPPVARDLHAAVYDPVTNRMTVFGGRGLIGGVFSTFNDAWVLTDANGTAETIVDIDIKPGSDPNGINPRSKGVIPVAILTTDTFDATTVHETTVLFGATGTEAAPVRAALEDVDLDGDTDMVLHFNTQATGIQCGDTSASLTGQTLGGQAITGSDSVKTAGCK